MQENVSFEIPEQTSDVEREVQEWIPPVLKKTEIPEEKHQSCADIFFIQYVVCIVILTILFSVRLWDEQSFQNAVEKFNIAIHKESESWVLSLIEQVKAFWS